MNTIGRLALACAISAALAVQATGQQYVWHPVGAGVNNPLYTLTVYSGELIAGGSFTTAGGLTCNYIARWNGSTWQPLGTGMNSSVFALTVHNDELIAGGWLTTAGGVTCNYIARWNGSTWQPLGTGMNSSVLALMVYNGELVAGGQFTTAGGATRNYIARWNGSTWQPLGSGMNAAVRALTVCNGELIAGGSFTTAGGVTCNYIARWNGSTWQPLGTGMSGASYWYVAALTVYNGDLIAGGYFTTAGGVTCNHIARWNGTQWQPLGTGMNGIVYALTVYNGDLIAGGAFTTAGGLTCNRIARWDGSTWQPLGTGMNGEVYALRVYNDEPIAGGAFITAGGVPCHRIAGWGPVGACCFADGTCQLMQLDACTAAGGTWNGAPTCNPNPCPRRGACCFADAHCAVVLEPECTDPNGPTVFTPGATCDPNPCCSDPFCGDFAADEGEANCGLPNDTVNGGCNVTPALFSTVPGSGSAVCGTTALIEDGEYLRRDTDWYIYDHPGNHLVVFAGAQFEALVFVLGPTTPGNECDPNLGGWYFPVTNCNFVGYYDDMAAAGRYVIVVAPDWVWLIACANQTNYELIVASGLPGACCFDDQCVMSYRDICTVVGGEWDGAWSCDPNPCGVALCPGDTNCDGEITFADIDFFVEALGGEENWTHDPCPWLNADCNGDGDVTFADIDAFVALIGTQCP